MADYKGTYFELPQDNDEKKPIQFSGPTNNNTATINVCVSNRAMEAGPTTVNYYLRSRGGAITKGERTLNKNRELTISRTVRAPITDAYASLVNEELKEKGKRADAWVFLEVD